MENVNPAANSVKSVEEIRQQFPALERIIDGHPVAYFDGPGGTQVPRSVVEAMNDYMYNHNANTHWAYTTSRETDEIIEDSRQAMADFLNAEPDEIVYGQNMTTLTFHLARSLGREMNAGDEIIVTELDHHANVDTWASLERDRGVVIRKIPMNTESGQLELDVLANLLSDKTRLLAIGAASNALGTINDIGWHIVGQELAVTNADGNMANTAKNVRFYGLSKPLKDSENIALRSGLEDGNKFFTAKTKYLIVVTKRFTH